MKSNKYNQNENNKIIDNNKIDNKRENIIFIKKLKYDFILKIILQVINKN